MDTFFPPSLPASPSILTYLSVSLCVSLYLCLSVSSLLPSSSACPPPTPASSHVLEIPIHFGREGWAHKAWADGLLMMADILYQGVPRALRGAGISGKAGCCGSPCRVPGHGPGARAADGSRPCPDEPASEPQASSTRGSSDKESTL